MVSPRSWMNEISSPRYHRQHRPFLSLLIAFTTLSLSSSSRLVAAAAEESCSRSTITSTITKTLSATGTTSPTVQSAGNIGSGSKTVDHASAPTGGGGGLAGGGETATCSATASSRSTLTSTITTTLTRTKTATETSTVTGGAHQQQGSSSSSSSSSSTSTSAKPPIDAPSTNPVAAPSGETANQPSTVNTSETAMPHETSVPQPHQQPSGYVSQGQLSSTETCTTSSKAVVTSTSRITNTRTVTKTNNGYAQPQTLPTGSSATGSNDTIGAEHALQTIYWKPGQSGAPSMGTGYEESIKHTASASSTTASSTPRLPSSSAATGGIIKPPASDAIQRHTSKGCVSCGESTSVAVSQAKPKTSYASGSNTSVQQTTTAAPVQPTTTNQPSTSTGTGSTTMSSSTTSSTTTSASGGTSIPPDTSSGSSALLQKYTTFTDIQLNVFQWDPSTCTTGTWAGSCAGYFDPASCGGLPPVSLSQAVIGSNGSPEHKAFCGKTITIQANGKTTKAIIAGLAGDPIIDSCLPLPAAIGFEWTESTYPGHKPVQWKVEL